MLACFFILGALLAAPHSPLVAQWGGIPKHPVPQSVVLPGPHVIFDLLAFKHSSGEQAVTDSTRMDLYFAVDYNSLEFLYAVDKYVADYSVTVQIMNAGTLILDRYESYNVLESITEHHDRIQNHQSRADARQISFLLAPEIGNHPGISDHPAGYNVRLSVQDYSSHNSFDTSFDVTVKDFASSAPAMSDLLIYRDRKGMQLAPSIGPDVSSLTNEPSASGLFAELYNMPADSTLGIVTELQAVAGNKSHGPESFISRATTTLHIPSAKGSSMMHSGSTAPLSIPVTPLFAPVSFAGLWTGDYMLRTYILPSAPDTSLKDPSTLERRAIVSSERKILVAIAEGIPISSGDLDQAIAQLGVIATAAEWDSLSSARTAEQKRNAILDFWKEKGRSSNSLSNKRDASTANRAMDIFYSRVEYANSHFGTTFQAGWKSDRGHVYIALGPPNFIDSHPKWDESSPTTPPAYGGFQKPYEIWDYSADRSYTFVDDYMLGNYRIQGALPPEGTFEWDR